MSFWRSRGRKEEKHMISVDNQPPNAAPQDEDFTIEAYHGLVRLCLSSYTPASYDRIPWGQRFVLWRHDCDYSLNRALAVGRAEHDEGLNSTFFVNPHSEFYNLLERSQLEIVKSLLGLGHEVGLHFDAAFHATRSEDELHDQIAREARLLEELLGKRPAVFSFHNPTAFHLGCEAETYGGLVNCYSRRFKTEVPYCSDSNGYWRFRRLSEVLSEASDSCLQVLTHPGWWQSRAMPPRQRVFRCAFGRARATMLFYDQAIEDCSRENFAGTAASISFLRSVDREIFEALDYLWNMRRFATLFLELSRLHETQLRRICKAILIGEWRIPVAQVCGFLDQAIAGFDGLSLFKCICGRSWLPAGEAHDAAHRRSLMVRDRLAQGAPEAADETLEADCVELCGRIESLAVWGRGEPIGLDGLSQEESASDAADTRQGPHDAGDPEKQGSCEICEAYRNRWEALQKHAGGLAAGAAVRPETAGAGRDDGGAKRLALPC